MLSQLLRCFVKAIKNTTGLIVSAALVFALSIFSVTCFQASDTKEAEPMKGIPLRQLVEAQPGQSLSENVFPTLQSVNDTVSVENAGRDFSELEINGAIDSEQEIAFEKLQIDRAAWNTFGRQEPLAASTPSHAPVLDNTAISVNPSDKHEVHLAIAQPATLIKAKRQTRSTGKTSIFEATDSTTPGTSQTLTEKKPKVTEALKLQSVVEFDSPVEKDLPEPNARAAKKNWETGRY